MNTQTSKLLAVGAFLCLSASLATAQSVVADYNFATNLASSDASTFSTASAFSGNKTYYVRSGVAQNFLLRNVSDSSNTNTYATSRFGALTDVFSFVSFTVTLTEEASFNNLSFNYGGGASGGRTFTANFAVFTNLTGFTDGNQMGQTSLNITADATTTPNAFSLDLSSVSALQSVSAQAVTFRIYYWVTNYSSTPPVGTFDGLRLDNVSLTATAIPEPSAYAGLAGLAVLALAGLRRRREA